MLAAERAFVNGALVRASVCVCVCVCVHDINLDTPLIKRYVGKALSPYNMGRIFYKFHTLRIVVFYSILWG